jgi:hypothetical protein
MDKTSIRDKPGLKFRKNKKHQIMALAFYGIYVFLAVFNAGNMVTLQIQHYGIYASVGKENFKNYMRANNKSSKIPSIIPAIMLLLLNILLIFIRPPFMSASMVILALILNFIALFSTFIWQRKLQSEMAVTGYDESKINKLISTNWIRTFAFLIQAVFAVLIIVNAVK